MSHKHGSVDLRWTAVSEQHPAPHAKYLVRRDRWRFVATPCYGMHAPWWVPATCGDLSLQESEPIGMVVTDEWVALDDLPIEEGRRG